MAGTDSLMNLFPDDFTHDSCKFTKKCILGQGGQGVVALYEAPDPYNRAIPRRLAAKCDLNTSSSMSKEAYYMNKLAQARVKHVPKLHSEKYHNNKPFLVMQCIDYSVPEYIAKYDGQPGRLTKADIFVSFVSAIQGLHEAGFIHQDVKPDNFRISEDNQVYIIDFGLLNEYRVQSKDKQVKHKPTGRYGFQGSPFFASINALNGNTLSRRDDIECIGYSILYLMFENEQIPWNNQKIVRDIHQSKENFLKQNGQGDIDHVRQFIKRARRLSYEEDPDYTAFKHDLAFMNQQMKQKKEEEKAEEIIQLVIKRRKMEDAKDKNNKNNEYSKCFDEVITKLAKAMIYKMNVVQEDRRTLFDPRIRKFVTLCYREEVESNELAEKLIQAEIRSQLRNECRMLKTEETISQAEAKLKATQDEISVANANKEELKRQNQKQNEIIKESENKIALLKESHQKENEALTKLRSKVLEAQRAIDSLEQKKTAKTQELGQIEVHISQANSFHKQVIQQIEESKKEFSKQETQNTQLTRENIKLQEAIDKFNKEHSANVAKCNREIAQLQSSISALTNQQTQLTAGCKELQKKQEDQQNKINANELKIKNLISQFEKTQRLQEKQHKDSLELQDNEFKAKNTELTNNHNQLIKKLNIEKQKIESHIQTLNAYVKDREDQVLKLTGEYNELQKLKEQLNNDIKGQQIDLRANQIKITDLVSQFNQTQIDQEKAHKEKLHLMEIESQNKLSELTEAHNSACDKLKNEQQVEEQKLKNLQASVQEQNTESQRLDKVQGELTASISELQGTINELKTSKSSEEFNLRLLKERFSTATQKVQDTEKLCEEHSTKLSSLRDEVKALTSQSSQLQGTIAVQEQSLDNISKALKNKQIEFDEFVKQSEIDRQQMQTKKDQIQLEITLQDGQISKLNEKFKQANQELLDLQSVVSKLTQQKQELFESTTKLSNQKLTQQEELSDIEKTRKQKEGEITQLEVTFQTEQKRINTVLQQLEQQITLKNEENEELQKKSEVYKQGLVDLNKKLDDLKSEIERLTENRDNLKGDLKTRHEELKRNSDQSHYTLEKLNIQIGEANASIQRLNEEVQALQSQKIILVADIENQQNLQQLSISQFKELQEKLNNDCKLIANQKNQIELEIKSAESSKLQLQKYIEENTETLEKLRNDCARLRQEEFDFKSKAMRDQQDLKNSIQQLQLDELSAKLKVEEQQKQLELLRQKNEISLSQMTNQKQQELSEIQTKLAQLNEQILNLEKEVQRINEEISKANLSRDSAIQGQQEQEKKLKELNDKILEVEVQYKAHQIQLGEINKLVISKNQELEGLDAQIKQKQEQLQTSVGVAPQELNEGRNTKLRLGDNQLQKPGGDQDIDASCKSTFQNQDCSLQSSQFSFKEIPLMKPESMADNQTPGATPQGDNAQVMIEELQKKILKLKEDKKNLKDQHSEYVKQQADYIHFLKKDINDQKILQERYIKEKDFEIEQKDLQIKAIKNDKQVDQHISMEIANELEKFKQESKAQLDENEKIIESLQSQLAQLKQEEGCLHAARDENDASSTIQSGTEQETTQQEHRPFSQKQKCPQITQHVSIPGIQSNSTQLTSQAIPTTTDLANSNQDKQIQNSYYRLPTDEAGSNAGCGDNPLVKSVQLLDKQIRKSFEENYIQQEQLSHKSKEEDKQEVIDIKPQLTSRSTTKLQEPKPNNSILSNPKNPTKQANIVEVTLSISVETFRILKNHKVIFPIILKSTTGKSNEYRIGFSQLSNDQKFQYVNLKLQRDSYQASILTQISKTLAVNFQQQFQLYYQFEKSKKPAKLDINGGIFMINADQD